MEVLQKETIILPKPQQDPTPVIEQDPVQNQVVPTEAILPEVAVMVVGLVEEAFHAVVVVDVEGFKN
tara:strand:+ start:311 stop:511 length:201 start_codon:yes stop_codon:yes gene_type:complete